MDYICGLEGREMSTQRIGSVGSGQGARKQDGERRASSVGGVNSKLSSGAGKAWSLQSWFFVFGV